MNTRPPTAEHTSSKSEEKICCFFAARLADPGLSVEGYVRKAPAVGFVGWESKIIAAYDGKTDVYVVEYKGKDKNTTQDDLVELVGVPDDAV